MRVWAKISVLILLVFLAGCTLPGKEQPKTTPPTAPESSPPKPYYTGTEFPNIVVPTGLMVDQAKSMIVRTQNYIGGVLVLKGRIKGRSLELFFKNQLKARGWELTGSIFYRSILLTFKRPNGCCMILITEQPFTTEVQIWASETLENDINQ
ncbi:hypothetical protein Thein_1155 [Thermodesulfatator indicus DSM 15286]|uniref:Lipoprotein n=1 Tax=Thermodesulfatator indicus (strain DSM 15286 / JCM 11887 / CIR29812) TaxID=667014 RepID=F8A830_THEID|nr:hypothetical protein [Thermodesulfatator indicus]AEH45023.1 hypothetical protein Thein_1155 [Thermodesulfatator indicus DSM 15286]